jgi:hypothetical protein
VSTLPGPNRLHAMLAAEANVGVVFCHANRTRVWMIRWDTARDAFEAGQWLTGELEGRELSPDGNLLAYSASKFPCSERKRYSAISRPPNFSALAYWIRDYWQHESRWGTASFLANDRIRLRHVGEEPDKLPDPALGHNLRVEIEPWRPDREQPLPTESSDGWRWLRIAPDMPAGSDAGPNGGVWAAWLWGEWARCHPRGWGELRRIPSAVEPHGVARRTPRWTYVHLDARLEPTDVLDGTTWADWDRRGRLVFARAGKLFAADAEHPEAEPHELADFSAMRFELVKPPAWATEWPATAARPRAGGNSESRRQARRQSLQRRLGPAEPSRGSRPDPHQP